MEGTDHRQTSTAVCVTGATGYIGSWLVGSLLRRGYTVHATVRDKGKASWLLSLFSGHGRRLKLFEADLNEEGSFDEPVKGCEFVLHVAANMLFNTSGKINTDEDVRRKILEPAVRGVAGVLQSCARSGSVKRVIFTSSISTITAKDGEGEWKKIIDESSVIPVTRVWKTKPSGWVYVLSKLLTEEKAYQFAKEKGIDLVSIIPPTVAGPFLTPSVPASLQVLLSPITGDPNLYPIMMSVYKRLGSIPLVHIEDICNAHIFLMEQSNVEGRYMCCVDSYSMSELIDLLSFHHPPAGRIKGSENSAASSYPEVSSKRLTNLGFKFTYDLRDIVQQSVACCADRNFLSSQN